ncbi:hypothetical protein D3Z51_07580 [Clostridiaceae bacterium]|nr:hypothetical protein [Clostridiaceae bacterium]RKI14989.1 hypothetical protein D7V81_07070 [bacterium 1XD21-70]
MPQYIPISGTILQIEPQNTISSQDCCSLNLTLQTDSQGPVQIILTGSTYVPGCQPLTANSQVTCFYSPLAPVPLIYPPQYRALAVVPTPNGTQVALDVFTWVPHNSQFANPGDTLRLNLSSQTDFSLPNGQPFAGSPSGHLMLVTYHASTRSIPAQATPDKIVVFCGI